jgi:histidine triad (HIT) family protein
LSRTPRAQFTGRPLRVRPRAGPRPALDETVRGPLSRQKPGTHLPAARAAERWTSAFRRGSVQILSVVCRDEPLCFLPERTTNGIGAKVPTVDLETCVFCELVAGKLPISVVDETADVLALMDIQPVNPGHVLIIPKRHAPYLADLDATLGDHIFAMGTRVAAALRRCGVRCEGVNLFLADGEAAGQGIFHAHLHVFPRFAGDGFGLKFSPNYFILPSRADLDDIAKNIRDAVRA